VRLAGYKLYRFGNIKLTTKNRKIIFVAPYFVEKKKVFIANLFKIMIVGIE